MKVVRSGIIDANDLTISQRETELRLGLPAGELESKDEYREILKKCEKTLLKEADIRYAFFLAEADIKEDGCDFGVFSIESKDLKKNLRGCCEAAIMGVTLGQGVDRLLKRLSLTSKSEHFFTDALASALAEAAADRVEELARETRLQYGSCGFRPRYSPGYGDCMIENQRALLSCLKGEKTLGISLNEHCFMNPVKSVTAIMGICV